MNNFIKRSAAVLLSAAMLFSVSACGSTSDDTPADSSASVSEEKPAASARVTVDGTKFMVDGKELWLNGVNTPWWAWNDFTGKMDEQFWDDTFATLAADGVNCTRIWINCNGEGIVRLKTTGEFKELREGHWSDLDKLFAIAEKHGVYVMATLLSFDHFKEPNGGYDKWRKLITSKENTQSYIDNYLVEFCKRYGSNEYLFAIDIMNEPDWVYENDECGRIGWENLSYFFGKCAAAIHENCDTLVTVGTAMPKYNSDNYSGNYVSDEFLQSLTGDEKAYLDFYSPHYYIWERQSFGFPFDQSPVSYGIEGSKPCITGETSNDDADKAGMTLTEKYKSSYENGWNGLLVWMDPCEEDYHWYRYDLTKEATTAMAEYIPEKIYPIGKKAADNS